MVYSDKSAEIVCIRINDIVNNSIKKIEEEKKRIIKDKKLTNYAKDQLLKQADKAKEDFEKIKCDLWE